MIKKWGFEEFNAWANEVLTLDLAAYKQRQLQRRINTVMKQAGVSNLYDYSKKIEQDNDVRQEFLDYITINVTDFFRNPTIFDEFEEALKDILAPKFGPLNIWSAACSIGSEPYSIAMLMKENNLRVQNKILATDIDEKILQRGIVGTYSKYELKNLQPHLLEKYFKENGSEYNIEPTMKSMVNFKTHDLLNDRFQNDFHAIICRNVIIYFKKEVKEELYRKFSESLVPGGILFTGATETIYRPEDYGLEKIGTFLYRKK